MKVSTPEVRVVKRNKLATALRDNMKLLGVRLNSVEIESAFRTLLQYCHADDVVKEQHVDNIERKYGSAKVGTADPVAPTTPIVMTVEKRAPEPPPPPVPMQDIAATAEVALCPLCGRQLEKFDGRRGQYLGCPGCNYRGRV